MYIICEILVWRWIERLFHDDCCPIVSFSGNPAPFAHVTCTHALGQVSRTVFVPAAGGGASILLPAAVAAWSMIRLRLYSVRPAAPIRWWRRYNTLSIVVACSGKMLVSLLAVDG